MKPRRVRRRYRWRTKARTLLPYVLSDRVGKGSRDCGDHEWYLATPGTWHCYHCLPGVTHEDPARHAPPRDDP